VTKRQVANMETAVPKLMRFPAYQSEAEVPSRQVMALMIVTTCRSLRSPLTAIFLLHFKKHIIFKPYYVISQCLYVSVL
jgi:hypothetical protein